jgi:hypothetical protein
VQRAQTTTATRAMDYFFALGNRTTQAARAAGLE